MINIPELEQHIQQLQQANAALTAQLNDLRVHIVETATEYIGDYLTQQFESQMDRLPERTKELYANHQLDQLKTEFSQTIEEAPQHVRRQLENINCWVHLSAVSDMSHAHERDQRFDWMNTTQRMLIALFQEMLGSIGQLLYTYGYISKDTKTWQWEHGKIIAYTARPSFGKTLEGLMDQQRKLLEEFIELQHNLSWKQTQKEQAEAKHLWHNANVR